MAEKTPNNAAEWNAALIEQAGKEGVKPEEIAAKLRITETPAAEVVAKEEKKEAAKETPLSQTFEVGGKKLTFSGATNEDILRQAVAAYSAAAPAPVPVVVEQPKKVELSKDDMFRIGTDLMTGKPEAIREYVSKSGMLDDYFKEKNIDLSKLSAATQQQIETEVQNQWGEATKTFLALPGNDYPGGEINKIILGTKIAEMGLGKKPSVESISAAYAEMKKLEIVHRPAAAPKKEEVKKAAPGSSAFGKGAEADTRKNQAGAPSLTRDELAKMSPAQIQAWTNEQLSRGVNPETVVIQ